MAKRLYVVMKQGGGLFGDNNVYMVEAWPTRKQANKRAKQKQENAQKMRYFVESVIYFTGTGEAD